jgi:hypothetical protein
MESDGTGELGHMHKHFRVHQYKRSLYDWFDEACTCVGCPGLPSLAAQEAQIVPFATFRGLTSHVCGTLRHFDDARCCAPGWGALTRTTKVSSGSVSGGGGVFPRL